MALKYFLEYTDTIGTQFRCEISDVNYNGQAREINGSGRLEFPSVQNVLEPLRGSVFTLDLEASRAVDLNDLYSENETDITVDVFRNENLMFKGFVKPDGIFTDFVNEIYTISLDCIDGLGTLKDLSFVTPGGLHFQGFMREIDIVYNCLLRTSLDMPINVNIGIFHNEIIPADEDTADVLHETKLSTERFYKADKEENEVMDCEEVLKAVLEKYCAIIHQFNGEWYIYRPQDFANLETSYFYRYESGVRVSDTAVESYDFNIGSQIDAFYPHHCNGNQRININGSVSAFRVNYKYGFLKGIFPNPNLFLNGSNMDGWDILDPPLQQAGVNGGLLFDFQTSNFPEQIISDPINVSAGYELTFRTSFENLGRYLGLWFTIKLTDGAQTMYYHNYGGWKTTLTNIAYGPSHSIELTNYYITQDSCPPENIMENVYHGSGGYSYSLPIDPMPFDGELTIEVSGIYVFHTDLICNIPLDPENYLILDFIDLVPKTEGSNVAEKGEIHTVYRDPRSSSISEDNKTVYNGDMVSDIYEGTIKTADNNNTVSWRHKGKTEAKEILRIMVEDTLKTRIRPQKLFIGDIYGFAPFLRTFRINNVQGNYMPISYIYNTKENIVSLNLVEVPSDIDSIAIKYEKTIDYGNVIKPTIV